MPETSLVVLGPPQGGFLCGPTAVGVGAGVCPSDWSPEAAWAPGSVHPPSVLPRPAGQGLGRALCETREGRGREGQQVTSCDWKEVFRSGAESSLGAPRVRPVPRWHLRASRSTAGQNRNFLGPSGSLRERGVDGHDTHTRHRRVRTTTPGMLHKPRPTASIGPRGSWAQTTTPGMLRRAEVGISYCPPRPWAVG